MKKLLLLLLTLASAFAYIFKHHQSPLGSPLSDSFTDSEIAKIESLLLDTVLRVPDTSAPKKETVRLGEKLFNDEELSASLTVSCATCHTPEANFHDINNMTKEITPAGPHRAMSIRGVSEQSWFFWNGRADSLWAQILEALKNEHGLSASNAVQIVCSKYSNDYSNALSFCSTTLDTQKQFVEIGKIIASYVETLNHYWTRFDEFGYQLLSHDSVDTLLMSEDEIQGLKLFLDSNKTGCIDCHNGSRFTSEGFYAIGTGSSASNDRLLGAQQYQQSRYRCDLWEQSQDCANYQYVRLTGSDLSGAFKVPSLRNLKDSPRFMHDGRFDSLAQVLDFYKNPYSYPLSHTDVRPLRLMPHQREQLLLFLKAINDEYSVSFKHKL
ncbi:hypothetical protein J4N42_08370 [Vibrio sp. SCSIO 43135]|uniref:cytochrome-c peroxidase n=1 Tax=Vibrio sp. SCSIO 43135 TaxID=2819096 RepID=UPI002074D2D7|nr:cytochrome c peroxidase [Vibrio sp. SCSIO 43135]USD40091.1 hypothetical protein J4N42_08370 [Vibrio sp. SCSIO 43135]